MFGGDLIQGALGSSAITMGYDRFELLIDEKQLLLVLVKQGDGFSRPSRGSGAGRAR